MAKKATRYVFVSLLLIGGFFLSIQMISASFQAVGNDIIETINYATSNPFIGLFIGLLITAVLQSSSTTTSMTVVAVAAGSISLQNAIPIVMGANIGTTLTSTIVSMSYVTKTREFKKAVSAGSIHDIFNILVCIILFPLELSYGLLSKTSSYLASFFQLSNEVVLTASSTDWLSRFFLSIIDLVGPIITLIVAILLLFTTVKYISKFLYEELIGKAKTRFEELAFENTFKSFGWGFLLTAIIQSSSLTTSLIVPLVATNKVKLKRAFQFVVGANLGTTITALLAAIFKSDAALSLAIAHFLFNAIGMLLFISIPFLTKLPIFLAKKLGIVSLRYKVMAFAYILIMFFLLPFTLIYFSNKSELNTYHPQKEKDAIEVAVNN